MTLNRLIHIGFPKTGSTTHQNHLFARHPEIIFPGKPYEDEVFKTQLYRLIKEESTTYDPAPLKALLEKLPEPPGKKAIVISDEIMVSVSKVRDKGIVAQRIKDVFGPCKILITIRNQLEILKSTYISGCRLLTEVPGKYRGRFVGFEEWLEFSYEKPDRSHIGNFIYINTIDYYARLFGRDNILVLAFEEFIRDKTRYIKKLSTFTGIDQGKAAELMETAHDNERIHQERLEFEQLMGRHISMKTNPWMPGAARLYYFFQKLPGKNRKNKARVSFPAHWEQRLTEIYSSGNKRIMHDYNLDLESYGYPL